MDKVSDGRIFDEEHPGGFVCPFPPLRYNTRPNTRGVLRTQLRIGDHGVLH